MRSVFITLLFFSCFGSWGETVGQSHFKKTIDEISVALERTFEVLKRDYDSATGVILYKRDKIDELERQLEECRTQQQK